MVVSGKKGFYEIVLVLAQILKQEKPIHVSTTST